MSAVIEGRGMVAGYGPVPVLTGVDIHVGEGEVVALLGSNGAGKTTTLLSLAGELPLTQGEVLLDGKATKAPLHRRASQGVAFVTEERSIFRGLTTADNLRVGKCSESFALELFPELEKRMSIRGGMLSGGEQQMLTLARALGRHPRLLMADELSMGLAPLIVDRLLQAVATSARERGTGVLLVEQHVRKVIKIADRIYVMRRGKVVLEGLASELRGRIGEIEEQYLAGAAT
ncbi:ABC transporter ATP-binding protein [Herbiconiux sp. P16]|uniref:ABC transporter ATP-binding protein n=1 Tax=Herbiconiux wuyangfengii TaxID=3342794 RepID=UPI0035B891CC